MSRFWSKFRPRSIALRLLFWFLVISVVPSAALTAIAYWISSDSLETAVRERLRVISMAKSNALENYAKERRGDAAVIGNAPGIQNTVQRLSVLRETKALDSPEYIEVAKRDRESLQTFSETYGYPNILLFNLNGDLLLRLRDDLDIGSNLLTGRMKDTELANAFGRATSLLQVVVSDFQMYQGRTEPVGFVAGPITDSEGFLRGVVMLELSNRDLFRTFKDHLGLGQTGETILAALKGDEVTIVAPTRHDPNASFRRKVRLGDPKSLGLQRAVKGSRGYGELIDYRGKPVISVYSYLPSFRWGIVVQQERKEAYALVRQLRAVMLGLLIFTGLAVVLVARAVALSLSRPIQVAAEVAESVASGDLSPTITIRAWGETGQLLDAIRKMTDDLRSLIGSIQRSSVTLMSTATEIAATSRQQEQTIHEHGASTNQAVAAVKEISATSQELLKTMNEVNTVAGETATMASDGQGNLAGMDKTMRQLVDSTGSISSKLSVISERAANINLVVTTITKVADQTNLLSINAAIEAEKAGEYGLGFLVVAREIRRLADQTAVATLDIERMVKEMQYSVSAGVMEMDKFSDQVRQGVGEVSHIREQLGQIIDAVQTLTGRFDQVTDGMRAQSQGADQIREAMVRLSEGSNQTAVSLREFNSATSHMREAIGVLKEEVSRFTLDAPSSGGTAVG
jgi:methyl-accepting chemotaxis protein WspA